MKQICPNCRSELYALGVPYLDFTGIPKMQALNCPVCDQEIWLSSGVFIPTRYTNFLVLKAETWDPEKQKSIEVKQNIPGNSMWLNSSMPIYQKIAIIAAIGLALFLIFRGGVHIHKN